MKLVRESLNENIRIPISTLSWEDVKPMNKTYVNLPSSFMSSQSIYGPNQFERWYEEFTQMYGTEGELVKSYDTYKIVGNKKWDDAYEHGAAAVSKYYDEKPSGGFTGD